MERPAVSRLTRRGADRAIHGRDRQSHRSRRVNCGVEGKKLDQVEAGRVCEHCRGHHRDGDGGAVIGQAAEEAGELQQRLGDDLQDAGYEQHNQNWRDGVGNSRCRSQQERKQRAAREYQ